MLCRTIENRLPGRNRANAVVFMERTCLHVALASPARRRRTMSTIHLDAHEQRQLLQAQAALLSSLSEAEPRDWQLRANRAVRELLGADHSVFVLPTPGASVPPVTSEDTGPGFEDGLLRLAAEAASDERYGDSFLERVHRRRVRSGKGAYHLEQFTDRTERAKAQSFQHIFVPHGFEWLVALSTQTDYGAVTQFFGFERPDADGYTERGLRKLRLLVPAFSAGVEAFQRSRSQRKRVAATLDLVPQPAALYDIEGHLLHRSRALNALLVDEPEREDLIRAVDELAAIYVTRLQGRQRAQAQTPLTVEQRIQTQVASYRLWGVHGPKGPEGTARILVQVERQEWDFPDSKHVAESHGLTPRQAQVALLLARGYSDKAIARRLDISWHTARTHSRNVLARLDLRSRAQVAVTLLHRPPGQ